MRMSDQAYNRQRVLQKLRECEPVSRTELAKACGLAGGTITAIIRDLVERGMIVEERDASSLRGRPRLNLAINPGSMFVVGATLTDDGEIIASLADLRGQGIATFRLHPGGLGSLERLAGQFCIAIERLIENALPHDARIAQIGIGLPARVDALAGTVEYFETLSDAPFPFAARIEQRLNIPTRIDNNINLLARAENWFGGTIGETDFTLVLFDLGIVAARYVGGQLAGRSGGASELGHTKLVLEGGRRCHCGGHGCLQTYSSMSALIYEECDAAGRARPGFDELRGEFLRLLDKADAGHRPSIEAIERAGGHLGRGIANHINMQEPGRVVLVTRHPTLTELLSRPFHEALERDVLPLQARNTQVIVRTVAVSSFAFGAAALVLEGLYQGLP